MAGECLTNLTNRFNEQVNQTLNDYQTTFTAGWGSSLARNPLLTRATEAASDIAANTLAQIINRVQEAALGPVNAMIANAMNMITFSDDLQILLFARQVDTLKGYVQNRITKLREAQQLVRRLRDLFDTLDPAREPLIYSILRNARRDLLNAEKALKRVQSGLRRNQIYKGSRRAANRYVNQAIYKLGNAYVASVSRQTGALTEVTATGEVGAPASRVLGGITGVDDYFRAIAEDIFTSEVQRYTAAAEAIGRTLTQLRNIIGVQDDAFGYASALGINVQVLNAPTNIEALSGKIKLSATGLAVFPFHILTLNTLLNHYADRVDNYLRRIQEVSSDMAEVIEGGPSNVIEANTKRLEFLTRLEIIATISGDSTNSPLSAFDETTARLAEDVASINNIIVYLNTDKRINNINQYAIKAKQHFIAFIPIGPAAVFVPTAYAPALRHLNAMISQFGRQLEQDTRLLSILSSLNITDAVNPAVQEAIERLDSFLEEMGLGGAGAGVVSSLVGAAVGIASVGIDQALSGGLNSALSNFNLGSLSSVLPQGLRDRFQDLDSVQELLEGESKLGLADIMGCANRVMSETGSVIKISPNARGLFPQAAVAAKDSQEIVSTLSNSRYEPVATEMIVEVSDTPDVFEQEVLSA